MRINELNIPDAAQPWEALGFTVVDGYIPIGRSFRYKLSDCEGKGVLDITFGDEGRSARTEFTVNGVSAAIEGNPDFLDAPLVQHANSVVGGMKIAILAADIDDSTAQYMAAMPELGKPQVSKAVETKPGRTRVDYWTNLEFMDFEIFNQGGEMTTDILTATMLFVDDLNVAIAAFGADNVGEKIVYMERDMVPVKPSSGVSPVLYLITEKLSANR